MGFEELSPELQEKAKACTSKEELAELAAAMGVRLSEEELESVAGGLLADACVKDRTCIKQIIGPCPQKSLCPMQSCLEYSQCTEVAPCPELVAPIEVIKPATQDSED